MNSLNQINVSEVKCEVVFRDEVQVKHLMLSKKDAEDAIFVLFMVLWFWFLFLISHNIVAMTRKPVSSHLGLTEAESTVCKRLCNEFL